MKGETHVTLGVATATTLMALNLIEPSVITIGCAAVASLLPDVDHDGAYLNKRFGLSNMAFVVIAFALLYYTRTVETYIAAAVLILIGLSRHRAITHSLIAVIGLFLATRTLVVDIRLGLLIGYSSHLLSDFFTHSGIEVFYPNKKNYKFPITIRTGKSVEKIVVGAGTLVIWVSGYQIISNLGWI